MFVYYCLTTYIEYMYLNTGDWRTDTDVRGKGEAGWRLRQATANLEYGCDDVVGHHHPTSGQLEV